MASVSSASASWLSSMPIACFTATRLAVPPTQLPLTAASGCQPSGAGRTLRNIR